MKKLVTLFAIALFVGSTVGCKSGMFAKRGASCSQCRTNVMRTSPMASVNPCNTNPCNIASSQNIIESPGIPSTQYLPSHQYEVGGAPAYEGVSSGTLPTPPGPIDF